MCDEAAPPGGSRYVGYRPSLVTGVEMTVMKLAIALPFFPRGPCGALCCVLAAMPASGLAQGHVWRVEGMSREDSLGASVASVVDLDGDGVPEILCGARSTAASTEPPGARLYSGQSGDLLCSWTYAGDLEDGYGDAVAALDDVDGDGWADLAVAAPSRPVGGAAAGTVYLYSSAGGNLLRSISNPGVDGAFGSWLGRGLDLDADGKVELVITEPEGANPTLRFYSTVTGALVRSHVGVAGSGFGWSFDVTGDIDGDAIADYVVAAPTDPSNAPLMGAAYLYSGASGAFLRAFTEPTGNPSSYAHSVSGIGDVDTDGIPDILVGSPQFSTSPNLWEGEVVVHSGANGNAVHVLRMGDPGSQNGLVVRDLDDITGDGVADFVAAAPDIGWIEFFDGASAAFLGWVEPVGIYQEIHLDSSLDFSGDGLRDVLLGTPGAGGLVQVVSARDRSILLTLPGARYSQNMGMASTRIADRNGDSVPEVAVGSLRGGGASGQGGQVQILSGSDGSELGRFQRGEDADRFGFVLAALPDVDGDGLDDLAVGCPGANGLQGLVEIRSGADDSVVRTLAEPLGEGFGVSISSRVDASGTVLLAVGSPRWSGTTRGRVRVYDAATGVRLLNLVGEPASLFGSRVESAGDVDQDGVIDWAVTSSLTVPGVTMISGSDRSTIWQHRFTTFENYGETMASIGDLDGDGVEELMGGRLGAGVRIWSGANGSLIADLPSNGPGDWFGASLAPIGDCNGDGFEDYAVGAPVCMSPLSTLGAIYLYSGSTQRLLYRVEGGIDDAHLGEKLSLVGRLGTASFDGDGIADLITGSPSGFTSHDGAGSVEVIHLDDLYLQIEPHTLAPGDFTVLATRGGPPGHPVGLYGVDFNGVPLSQFLALGSFDAFGEWNLSGPVPPGMSGYTLTLRSFAIGFQGRIMDSQAQVLTVP